MPGIIGTLQAMEAVKVVTGVGAPLSRRLLMLDALQGRMHTVKLRAKVRLQTLCAPSKCLADASHAEVVVTCAHSAQMDSCAACGTAPSITSASLASYDYAAFTGGQANDAAPPQLHLLQDADRLSPAALRTQLENDGGAVVDVRPQNQFDIAHIPGMESAEYEEHSGGACFMPACSSSYCGVGWTRTSCGDAGSISCPFDMGRSDTFLLHLPRVRSAAGIPEAEQGLVAHAQLNGAHEEATAVGQRQGSSHEVLVGNRYRSLSPAFSGPTSPGSAGADRCAQERPLYVVCRRGNDSQRVAQLLKDSGITRVMDVVGGLQAWAEEADPSFPWF